MKMNKHFWGVTIAVFGTLLVAVLIGVNYLQAAALFGTIALVSAAIVIHKIEDQGLCIGMLVGLSVFASFPLRKLFQIDGFVVEMSMNLVVCAALWVVGLGWKRPWR